MFFIKTHSFILFLSLLLVACGSQPPVPEDRFYRLPDVQSGENIRLSGFSLNKKVVLERLDTEGLYQERAILYVDDNNPLELRRYHYHHWVNSPVNIVSEHLLSYLRSVLPAGEVSRYNAMQNKRKDYQIGGKLVRFERVLNNGNPQAEVALELWVGADQNPRMLVNEYSASVFAQDGTMHATAIAFGKALEETYANFLQDLKKDKRF